MLLQPSYQFWKLCTLMGSFSMRLLSCPSDLSLPLVQASRLTMSRICHAVVSFVTLRHQMEASVPSLLHAIRLKLDANLEMLEVLSQTWPIARMVLELFQTTATSSHFNWLLTAAVEDCRRRSRGEIDDTSNGPRASFQRSRLQQVILPQSRVILQLLARTSQNRMPAPRSNSGSARPGAEVENESVGPESEDFHLDESPDGFSSALETDPAAILQNLQEIIRIGRSSLHNTGDMH